MASTCFGNVCVRRKAREFAFLSRRFESIDWGRFFLPTISMSSSVKPNIEIPKRIKRSDTAILEALATTISKDYTAPHYKFHDDPFFIPTSNMAKRTYALSKESGRKAARWICQEYSSCFQFDLAEPPIKDFMPKPVISPEKDASLDLLRNCISKEQVTTAVAVYEVLKSKGVDVDLEIKQSLLELMCFYNGEDPPEEDFIEERWFRHSSAKDRKRATRFTAAEKLFKEITPQTARSHAAMLRGCMKYMQADRAYDIYTEMREKQMPVDVGTYNHLLSGVCFLRESSESRWELAQSLLENMHKEGVTPNLGTMNSLLETVSRLGSWKDAKRIALRVLAEMRQISIEPSLGSYYYLLTTFCRERGPVSTILYDIMQQLKGREFEIRHLKDASFFITAMNVCHVHLQDKELAYQVHKLLNTGNNYSLIGDSHKEAIYYQHFFRLLCGTESIEVFFELYHKLVPHTYTPEPSVMLDIILAVEMSGTLQYIPKIWTDVVMFEQTNRENLLEALLSIMAANKPSEELQLQFHDIALDIQKKVDEQSLTRRTNFVQWTGPMLGNVMLVYLNSGDFEKACGVMEKCDIEQNKVAGVPTIEQLQIFVQAAIENEDSKNAIAAVKYMADVGYIEAGTLGKEILEKMKQISETQTHVLKEIVSGVLMEKSDDSS